MGHPEWRIGDFSQEREGEPSAIVIVARVEGSRIGTASYRKGNGR
jgi:hypothetical protein